VVVVLVPVELVVCIALVVSGGVIVVEGLPVT
jgi:hypothetical protein